MSHPQTEQFEEAKKEAEEEKSFWPKGTGQPDDFWFKMHDSNRYL